MSLERYLRGVVPREALSTWLRATLQAQAVAARTYSVYHRNQAVWRAYDLCDTTACQVCGGYDSEQASTNTAIAATAGQIRLYEGKPIMAEFSSSNGGATAAGPALHA
ncbi:SpoIID/LytB domain-containing protein [Kribbella sp. NPDC023972]|uniref:SpoIID/LytB domain-containing protein n=1 Tax=Kribbella sp. NPDC023972 TaxID=3154795 RepID=UPI0033F87E92